jgi:hypothetical protein
MMDTDAIRAAFDKMPELAAVFYEKLPSKQPPYPYAQVQSADHVFGDDPMLSITIWDCEPVRLRGLADKAEILIAAAPFKARMIRRRVVRDVAGPWAAAIDWRLPALNPNNGGDE